MSITIISQKGQGMKVKIPYGAEEETFSVPRHARTVPIRFKRAEVPKDAKAEIRRALDYPVGCARIEQQVKPGERVCIISDDITRPTPVRLILEELLPRLKGAGIRSEDIFIVMALGSHRPMTEEEIITKVGKEIAGEYRIFNSEFRNPEELLDMGRTESGAVIQVSKKVMDSDVRIGIGNIVPHPAMGWSGGAKILYPGVTSEDTVIQFHLMQGLARQNLFGMEECPVRLEVERWTDKIGLHYIINTVLTQEMQLYYVSAGHYIEAHREGVSYAKKVWGGFIEEKADVAVVSSYPTDLDYWQATKGYLCGQRGVKEGGTIILVTPCTEGVGPHPEYVDDIGNDDAQSLLEKVQKGEKGKGDVLALCIGACVSWIRRNYRLVTVSDGLSREEMDRANIKYYPRKELEKAVWEACEGIPNPVILTVSHGGEMVLSVENEIMKDGGK